MSLTIQEVEHIAELARLELSEEEINRYRQQLSAVLDYIARLQELDTSTISPTSSVLPSRTPLRADIARPGLPINDLLANAPQSLERQFKVPPVLE
jgi:aspartyl-tRNA(Asn)/glutamyl-tRNA(Gln) amidotransferase subunit C